VRQDASETLRPYSLVGQIATKECSKRYSFSVGVVAVWPNEKERTHAQTGNVGRLSYVWRVCRGALCAAFRRPALGDSPGAETRRDRGHRKELIRREAATLRSASGTETVGRRPLVFRLLHFTGGTLRVFVRRKARGKNNRSIPVELIGFESRSWSLQFYPSLTPAFCHHSPDPLIGLKI